MKSALLTVLVCSASTLAFAQPTPEPANKEVEDLVVVGSRLPTEDFKIGRAVTVLDATQINDLGYEYAADLFRFVPGVAVSRSGGYGGLTQLRLRGAEANHVLVLIDGIEVSAAGSGEFDFSSLLSADIERIEVLRGPQSGLFGSNALAGVISIHTRQPEAGFVVDINVEAGDEDTRQGGISISGGNERIQGRLSFAQRQSEFDLSTNDDIIGSEDDEDDNQTISGQLSTQLTDSISLSLFGRRTEKDTETDGFDFSGGPQQGLPIDNNGFSNTEDQTFGAVATLALMEERWITRLSAQSTETVLDGGTFGSDAERDQIHLDTSWQWAGTESIAQRTTLFFQDEEESFRNPYPFDPSQAPTQSRDLRSYGIEHRVEIDEKLFINATLRQDDNDDFEDETTYAVDVAYLFNGNNTRLHASYGVGVTNPTFFEQFGFVPGTFVGNPGLNPEQSRGWDVGVEHTFSDANLNLDITYFDADLEDEIQSLFPSVVNVNGESERQGVELSAVFQPSHNTTFTTHYTYTDADEPGGEEVRRPKHTGSITAAHSFMDGRLRISGSVAFNGEQLDNDFRNFFTNGFVAERTKLDSYTVANFNTSYNVTDNFQVYARVQNLLDEEYEEVLGYATPGRTVYAGLRFRLSR